MESLKKLLRLLVLIFLIILNVFFILLPRLSLADDEWSILPEIIDIDGHQYETFWPNNIYAGGIIKSGSGIYGPIFCATRGTLDLPDLPDSQSVLRYPSLIFGATESGNPLESITGWWTVFENPWRYESIANNTMIFNATTINTVTAAISIIYATNINVDIIDARVFNIDITNATTVNTSILNATNIDVDIIDARVFNVDVTYATTTNTTVLYASAVITLPYEQIFQGDGYTADIVMDHPAHTEGFIVEAITTEHISHVWEWELNSAYTQNLDADGYVTSISLVSGYRWYHNNRFRIRYVRADL